MIHINDNTCHNCQTPNLIWNLNYSVTHMEMFKCGHGLCKKCFLEIKNDFACPICKEGGQLHTTEENDPERFGKWISFAQWYNEFQIYIESGCATNLILNTAFGQQLLRLIKENKKSKKKNKKSNK